jgi:hypothetical protein
MKMTIARWDNGATIYTAEADSVSELLYLAVKDSASLKWANLNGASLSEANLNGANLSGASLRWANLNGASLSEANLNGANLNGANLSGASLNGASLNGASLDRANLSGASLNGASLRWATIIETGETWRVYLSQVLPQLLTSGGKTLADTLLPIHWNCHDWNNCPLAAAFDTKGIEGVPILLRPRAEQFIRYFDAGLITLEALRQ